MSNNFKLFFRGYNDSSNMNVNNNNNNVLKPLLKNLLAKKPADPFRKSRNSVKKNKKTLRRKAKRNNERQKQTLRRQNQFNKGRGRTLENSNLESNSSNLESNSSNLESNSIGSNNLGSNLDTNLKHILINPDEFTKILKKMMAWWKKTDNIQISEINFSNPLIKDRHLIEFTNILLPIIFTHTKEKFQDPDVPLIINFNNSQITNKGIDAFIDILLKGINLNFLSQFFPPGTPKLLIQGQLNYLKFTFTGCKKITIDGSSLLQAFNNIFEEGDKLIQTEFDNHPESINNRRLVKIIEELELKKKSINNRLANFFGKKLAL